VKVIKLKLKINQNRRHCRQHLFRPEYFLSPVIVSAATQKSSFQRPLHFTLLCQSPTIFRLGNLRAVVLADLDQS
jgi:hypothetical protein